MERLRVLNVPVDLVSMESALQFVENSVRSTAPPLSIVCSNPEKVYVLRSHPSLRTLFENSGLVIPDGVGITLAVRILYGKRLRRLAGADLMQAICAVAPTHGYRVFLYGSSPNVNRRAADILKQRYPGIQIVGCQHGYHAAAESKTVVDRINRSRPDILFVGLGSPGQELWIQQNVSSLRVKLVQGIGGTLDTIAGNVRRAPSWMRAVGLEWLYRLLRQPFRAHRQLNLARFIAEVVTLKAKR